MRVRRSCIAVALILLATAGLALASEPRAGARAAEGTTPSRMLVTASEWRFTLSRVRLPRGQALIELYNRGEDPHNLRIRRADRRGRVRGIGRLEPSALGRLELWLRRGKRYRLWCSLPAHRERGMRATLKVARKRKG